MIHLEFTLNISILLLAGFLLVNAVILSIIYIILEVRRNKAVTSYLAKDKGDLQK